jgi:hypothetical protein
LGQFALWRDIDETNTELDFKDVFLWRGEVDYGLRTGPSCGVIRYLEILKGGKYK